MSNDSLIIMQRFLSPFTITINHHHQPSTINYQHQLSMQFANKPNHSGGMISISGGVAAPSVPDEGDFRRFFRRLALSRLLSTIRIGLFRLRKS
jgi:hypothetical protein